MKRLFALYLRDPISTTEQIRRAFDALRSVSHAYNYALMPNGVGLWPGEPGPREDGDEDLTLLLCMESFVQDSIKGHLAVKRGKHPLDDIQDSPDYDGVDGPYGPGMFERPAVWPVSLTAKAPVGVTGPTGPTGLEWPTVGVEHLHGPTGCTYPAETGPGPNGPTGPYE